VGLEAIIDQIRADGQAQVDQILRQAECDARSILEQAQQEGGAIYQAAYQDAIQPSASECARVLNQARFEANCLLGQARENFITAVLEKLYQRMEHARASADYTRAMRGYLVEVLPGENGLYPLDERLRLQADPRDRDLLSELLRDEAMAVEVEYVLQCWGGINGVTVDGKARLVNTLETRVESAVPILRKELAKQFERQTSAAATPARDSQQPMA